MEPIAANYDVTIIYDATIAYPGIHKKHPNVFAYTIGTIGEHCRATGPHTRNKFGCLEWWTLNKTRDQDQNRLLIVSSEMMQEIKTLLNLSGGKVKI
jgi:hypothetical protein